MPEYRARLLKTIPSSRLSLLKLVADEAVLRALPLYLVGGFVRDLLLGRQATDFDLVVEGDAIALARGLAARHGGKVSMHARFGTAQWKLPESLGMQGTRLATLDLISTRSEVYKKPAALPTVHFGSLSDDLRRRDFTINTLAIRLDGKHFGELHDELGGLDDLRAGLVRVLHPLSFIDDPTRLFRLIRYEQRYGFRTAPETLALIPAALPGIALLSAQRLRHELDLVLEEEHAPAMLQRMDELDILPVVHPALGWDDSTRSRFLNAKAAQPELEQHPSGHRLGWGLWLMGASVTDIMGIEKRLHFESHLRDAILSAVQLYADRQALVGKRPSQVVARLADIPVPAIHLVALASPPGALRQVLCDYLSKWRHIKPVTDGEALKSLGLTPGPGFQVLLKHLREGWLDGEVKTAGEEKALLVRLLAERPAEKRG